MSQISNSRIINFFLTLIVLFQIVVAIPQLRIDLTFALQALGKPSLWRSALQYTNPNFADYVEFLNEEIPADARVVLPPKNIGPQPVSVTGIMQTYLAPREVINCTNSYESCISGHLENDSYILLFEEALINSDLPPILSERLNMLNDSWGFIRPVKSLLTPTTPLHTFQSRFEIILITIPRVIFLFVLALSGALIIHSHEKEKKLIYKLALGFGLSLGIITLFLYILLLLGLPFNEASLWGFLTVYGAAIIFVTRKSNPLNSLFIKNQMSIDLGQIIILFWGTLLTIISVGLSYHTTDALLIWASKGYGISAEGLAAGVNQWGSLTTIYPLNIPLSIAMFKTLFGDILPASKFIFPIFATSLYLVIYQYLSQHASKITSILSTGLLATSPLFIRHSTVGYANIVTTYYFIIAMLLLNQYHKNSKRSTLVLTSIFFILSGWTRPESTVICLVAILFYPIFFFRKETIQKTKQIIMNLVIPYLVFFTTWTVSSKILHTNPTLDQGYYTNTLKEIISGNLHLDDLWFIFKYFIQQLFSTDPWGYIGWAITILILSKLIFKPRSMPSVFLPISGALFIVMIFGVYYITSFNISESQTLSWWLGTGLNRLILPGIILIWISLFQNEQSKIY